MTLGFDARGDSGHDPEVGGQRRLVGRDQEVATIERLLDSDEPGLQALVIEGEPGIGKTTLWETLLDADAHDLPVLWCRPVEAETKLAFASLADLLAPVVEESLPTLPEPQRVSLEIALLRAAPPGVALDRRAVGTAVCSLLRASAADAPLVVAVDDVQWLDRASASALAFALRRLSDSQIRLVVARRSDRRAEPDALGLERILPGRVQTVRLGPLSLSGLYHVISAQLGQVFPRSTLRRIAETSAGNPLFAVELARALATTGVRLGAGEPLPVPETLSALMEDRIDRIGAGHRDVLLAAAALADPTPELIASALGEETGEALEAAERTGVVELRGGLVRFTHPLLASTVYASAAPQRRRALHGLLAVAVTEREEQARHLALAAVSPDEAVAERLDVAAHDANSRGAPEVAAELAELACRLTPAERADGRRRRSSELAEFAFSAGDTGRARELAEEVLEPGASGALRAGALELQARILHVAGTSAEAVECCRRALEEEGTDPQLRARIHATLALVSWNDFELAQRHAQIALELLEEVADPDPRVLSQALMAYVESEFYTGRGLPIEAVERGLALERVVPAPHVADRMSAALGAWLKYQGSFDEARRWLESAHRAAVEEGDDSSLPYVVGHLPQLELWTGNWDEAAQYAVEHLELAEATAQPEQRRQALYNLALVDAHRGRIEEARAEATELLSEAERCNEPWNTSNALAVLGFIELSLGDAEATIVHLWRNMEIREGIGTTQPARSYADFAEALIEVGKVERAEDVIGLLEERARIPENVPVLAVSARCRGLLAAAVQDLDGQPTRSATRWSFTTGQSCRSTRRERCSPSARCDAGAASERPRRRRSSAPGRSSTSWGRRSGSPVPRQSSAAFRSAAARRRSSRRPRSRWPS